MKNIFNSLVDFFIPNYLKVDKSLYEKTRISVLAFIIVVLISLPYDIFYFSNGYFLETKALLNYFAFLAAPCGLIIIKTTGKTNLALSLVGVIAVYLVTASVYLSGGLNSNDMLWYMVLSTAAFMFIGIRTGFILSSLCLLGITFFYWLDLIEFEYSNADSTSMSSGYRYFNFVLILSIISFMMFILVRGNKRLSGLIQLAEEQKVREKIARDFHDQIGNKLASIMHLSELIRMNKTIAEQEQIRLQIDQKAKDVYDNFRDFIWTLDAKSEQLTELFMYLRDFVDDYFKFSEVNLFINSVPDQLPDVLLPSFYSKEIIPMFKEAVTNIYKHSKAKNVYIEFIVSKSSLVIKLRDDGKGINENTLKNGNGIKNIKYRAEQTGGTITFSSSPLQGTEIIYSVNLPKMGS